MKADEQIDEERVRINIFILVQSKCLFQVKIREELSNMTFEELENLKRKIGTKIFKSIAAGKSETEKIERSFKRPTRNHPREMSSKIRPTKITKVKLKKTTTVRDPRFDPLCGVYEEKTFKENYKFVHEIRKKESQDLQKEYENATDEKTKKKIKFLMQRMVRFANITNLLFMLDICCFVLLG